METAVFPRMHVSLYVSDLAATVNFYTAFFGQPAAKIRRGYAKYVLDKPSLIISFVENPDRVASNFGHLGFQVETVQEMEQRLEAARRTGLLPREEMGTSCCYAKQDKFWVNDPDGVEWEVYYFHEDAEFNDPRYQQEYDQANGSGSSQCCIAPAAKAAPVAEEVLTTAPMAFTLVDATLANSSAAACTPGGGCC
ncbi:Glyoxalase/bleomycin resistance protein/dioxygenase [Hymenobacter roseosalivarius DSM 11622]|uniref:Glyoxalase/bleomycin resistance protein/dioxygenase n=1 Tax=Hymenobacter roseosalivarius DSM 11622 TaxID=645990 RepID=A0A1W1URN5_9BACT|nr:ArsI/CadI family heavy metal resistance metalloenzyme [Hymenobacter roseosalivarius]SMB83716.1 Glyoxalase/bleomycin resistance protein/dioxygenase [Hymenobacter roseosalivarius DSM 11622]